MLVFHTGDMATAARGWRGFRVYLEMIKVEHSVFALPFALIGMMWGSSQAFGTPWPGWRVFGLIVLAMVSCRSAAMAFNRIADRDIDAKNPRTKMRAIPSGMLKLKTANLYFYCSCLVFFGAAALLNPLSLVLSPIALATTLLYSVTKRFTPLCHFVLGLSLGIAPAAAWIASTGRLSWTILPLTVAVLLWTAGFDILYSLQDEEFDRTQGLRSLPQTFGVTKALGISRVCHALAVGALVLAATLNQIGPWGFVGIGCAAAILIYEQSLVKPGDLSKINMAFFTLNGFVSIGLLVFVILDKALPKS